MSDQEKELKAPDSWYSQSGVIPYRIKNEKLQILLITSRRKQRWIIPKGIIEDGLMPQESAAKEALEEAGAIGIVGNEALGKYKYKKWGGKVKVKVYPMVVKSLLDNWDEIEYRERMWYPFNEAKEILEIKKLKKLFERLKNKIK